MTNPQSDPMLQTPEIQEIIWALDLAATPEMSDEEVAEIWGAVKNRALRPASSRSGAIGRLREGFVQGLREVAATLVPEALVPSPAVRSLGTALPKLLVFETEEFVISISFTRRPGSETIRLLGQLVPRKADRIPDGGAVRVWSGQGTCLGKIDERGEFTVEGVPRGDLHMDILLGSDSIQVSPIHTHAVQITEE